MKTKVLILGAGPAGSMAARTLADRGFGDFLLVDKDVFPRPKICAGGISPASASFLKKIGMEHILKGLSPMAAMKSLRFIGPDGQEMLLASDLKAMTVNRKIFDKALLDEALNSGARFMPGFYVRDLLLDDRGRVCGATDGSREIRADVVILATGGRTKHFRETYLPDRRPLKLMHARMGWWKGLDLPEGRMEMIFDRDLLPHYGWLFPEGDGMVNIGICLYTKKLGNRRLTDVFNAFIDKYYTSRLMHAEPVGRCSSFVINTTGRVKSVYARRLLCAGEAGRLCNPATAEGISFAMESGVLAASAVLAAYKTGGTGPDERALASYEKMCSRAFNLRLGAAAAFSWFVDTSLFNLVVSLGSRRGFQKILTGLLGGV